MMCHRSWLTGKDGVDLAMESESEQPNPSVLTRWEDDVLVVTMNRPHVANALDSTLLQELLRAFETASDGGCGAIILTGSGRNFCAGADIKAYQRDPTALQLRSAFYPPLLALAALRKPVIAALNGAVAGGAIGFALAADIRIMATAARFVPSWVDIGLVPDLGTSWMLPRMIGCSRAFEWIASGEPMLAERALALGLANEIVPDGTLLERALASAQRLAKKPRFAIALTKQLLFDSLGRSFAEQLEAEAVQQALADRLRTENVIAKDR
jgi:2-(1,2-epoxy-1,2-dihydrophenyl)acetyl-CoA isomerase